MTGRNITIRGVMDPDREHEGGACLEDWHVPRENCVAVVEGEDLGPCLLLAFDKDGNVLFREDAMPAQACELYEVGARAIIEAINIETEEAD